MIDIPVYFFNLKKALFKLLPAEFTLSLALAAVAHRANAYREFFTENPTCVSWAVTTSSECRILWTSLAFPRCITLYLATKAQLPPFWPLFFCGKHLQVLNICTAQGKKKKKSVELEILVFIPFSKPLMIYIGKQQLKPQLMGQHPTAFHLEN